jgi:drug/metabolite transporter (DMT)-like permease
VRGKPPPAALVVAALLAVQVLFGVNYVVSKVVVTALPPLVWASARILVSALVMMAVAVASRRKHPTGGARYFVPLVGYALLGIIINQGSFLVGLRYTTSSHSAILNTMIPLFTLLVVTLRGQEALTGRRALGFAAALAGVLVLRRIESFSLSDRTMLGDALTLLNCLSYALFLSFGKKFMGAHDSVWTTAWLFVYGSVGLTAIAAPEWITLRPPPLGPPLVGAMIFAVVGGTLLAYFLNLWALAHTHSSSVALFIYLQPLVASVVAWGWLGETPTARTALSWGLIAAGFLLALGRNVRRYDDATETTA